MTAPDRIQSFVEQSASAMTYGGGVSAVAAWGLSWGDVAAVTGATVAVLGLLIQTLFMLRRDRRDREYHRHRMEYDD